MRTVTIEINGEFVRKSAQLAGAQGAGNVTAVRIIPDSSWDGMAKTITWFNARGENPVQQILTADASEVMEDGTIAWTLTIPPEPLEYAGECSFVLDGYVDGKRARTIGDKLSVAFSPVSDNAGEPSDPTPSQAEQLQEQIDAVLGTIHQANESAESAAQSAESAEENAGKSQQLYDGIKAAIDSLPQGSTLVINDMTTGGAAAALSAEQGRLLGELANLTNYQRALHNLGAGVRPNLLDNAYFVGGGTGWGVFPVNQKGKTQYTDLAIMFDRWKLVYGIGGVVELTPNGVTILGGTPYSLIRSSLRRTLPIGATYTITVLFYNGTMVSNVITVPTDGNPSAHTPITPGGTYVRLYGPQTFEVVGITGDKTPEIEFIKLEPGNRQTAAYQKPDGKWAMLPQGLNYQQELAKCQAYLQSFGIYDAFVCIDAADSYTDFQVPLSVPFRAQPVVLENGGIEGLSIGWYNKGNVLRLRILNRKGTVGEVIAFSSPCFLSAD